VAAEKMTYLFPAPGSLPAFGPFQVAIARGYYKEAGLDIQFLVAKGGADVAKQVGAGNAEMGNGTGDTSIIVRANGVPVRGVALLGGRALMQLIVRKDANIISPADLRGKTISVLSYQDTTFYALQGVLAKFGMTTQDVDAQAVGPAGVTQLVIAGKAVAMAGVPEWGYAVEAAGVPTVWFSADQYFPNMAQAIVTSDEMLKKRPQVVDAFVRATMKGLHAVMDGPAQAAKDFVAATPENAGKEKTVEAIFRIYDERVYPGQKVVGQFDPDRIKAVQDFYLRAGIIRTTTPIEDLYTNQFIQ
jgi:NitT/TauT family transport system substrate-binding protein